MIVDGVTKMFLFDFEEMQFTGFYQPVGEENQIEKMVAAGRPLPVVDPSEQLSSLNFILPFGRFNDYVDYDPTFQVCEKHYFYFI